MGNYVTTWQKKKLKFLLLPVIVRTQQYRTLAKNTRQAGKRYITTEKKAPSTEEGEIREEGEAL